jgi:hypothetical protein
MQRFVVQELPSGTCAKLLLRNGGFFFSLNFGITIGNQAQSGAEADTVMPYMRSPFSWKRINGVFGGDTPIFAPQRLIASKRIGLPQRRRGCQNAAIRKRPARARIGPPCQKRPA